VFLLVQEVLLMAIRTDSGLKGVEVVPGVEARERGMADDTVVYLQDAAQSARLFAIDEARLLKPQMWHADLLSIASLGAIAMLSERGVPPYFPAIYIQGLG
jgi:hypothetical protein